jgi:hypothetical protein
MSAVTMSSATPTPSMPATQLKPKEHGAYAILAIPILTALSVCSPSVASACIAVASITGFLAHEPLLVAIGHRGARAQRTSPAATKRLALLLAITIACGSTALLLGDTKVRFALAACAAMAIVSFSVAIAGKHRTMAGQLLGVVGLSIPCLPLLLAGGIELPVSMEVWGTWLIGFMSTTIAVRSVIASQKRQSRMFHIMMLSFLTLAVLLATVVGKLDLPIATTPMLAMSWFLLWSPPPAKYLYQAVFVNNDFVRKL